MLHHFLHIKWFLDPHTIQQSLQHYSFSELSDFFRQHPKITGLMIVITLATFMLHYFLEQNKSIQKLIKKITTSSFHVFSTSIMRKLFGIMLVVSGTSYELLAPDLPLTGHLGNALATAQIIIGIFIILGIFTRLWLVFASIFYFLGFFLFGTINTLNYIGIVGVIIFLFLRDDPLRIKTKHRFKISKLLEQYATCALPILRIFTGLDLIVLGLFNKIINPRLGLYFLEKFPDLNFTTNIGLNFTNQEFVIAAGLVEVIVGILLIIGIIPRIIALVLTVLFFTTLTILGLHELFGHLIFFGFMYVLFVEGSGKSQYCLHRKSRNKYK